MRLSRNVSHILDTLENAGYRADIVGGPVRDFLLGKEPSDYDITTSATPDEIKRVFSNERTVDTGIKHGTVTLVLDGEPYEITTYRLDGEYTDARHPDSVTFTTNIVKDLARRDFTVNAISYSPRHGICDPFLGREDIERKMLRAVGDPYARFSEDALRILRLIRFSSVLGFEVETETAEAARELSPLLGKISKERIYTEWTKLLGGEKAYRVIEEFSDIISVFIPELVDLKMPDADNFSAADTALRHLSLFAATYPSPNAASDAFNTAMRRLKSPTRPRDDGSSVLLSLSDRVENERDVGQILGKLGVECTRTLVDLQILLGISDETSRELLTSYITAGKPYRISDLEINGNDISALGVKGALIGKVLSALLSDVINGEVENEREALISHAQDVLKSIRYQE